MLFAPKEKGQGLIEYALILVLIAVLLLLSFVYSDPKLAEFSAKSITLFQLSSYYITVQVFRKALLSGPFLFVSNKLPKN